jgi:flagellar motility protein MotE (MotC chaperone)
MKKFLKAAGLVVLVFCAVNFFILGGLLLYVLGRFDVNRDKLSNARLALEGQRFMTEDEEKFLSKFEHEEIIEVWRKHQRAQHAAERRSAALDRREAILVESRRFLQMLNDQIEKRSGETEKLLAEIKSEREQTQKLKREAIIEVTSPSFRKQYESLMRMEPEAAAEVIKSMKAEEAAPYLSQMQSRKSAAILNALSNAQDGPKLCMEIIKKMRAVEDLAGQE